MIARRGLLQGLPVLLLLSGAGALACEVVWMRRLALVVGSSSVAVTLTLALYMGGLGLGSLVSGRMQHDKKGRNYAIFEICAASWALAMPLLMQALQPMLLGGPAARFLGASLLLVPPAALHGATLPALGGLLHQSRDLGRLYAINTAGAVLGVLAATFLLLPALGLRGTECAAAGASGLAGLLALALGATDLQSEAARSARSARGAGAAVGVGLAVAASGASAMALEVCWSRLGALLLGGSVYAFAVVLGVFLAGIALGARLGRRGGRPWLAPALVALGLLATLGSFSWRGLPHAVGLAWSWLGPDALLPAGALLLAAAMAGAPVASGVAFAAALDAPSADPRRVAGGLLAANTLGSVLGAALAGLVLLPAVGLQGTTTLAATLPTLAGAALLLQARRWRPAALGLATFALLALAAPRWDPSLYAVGVGLRVHEFADLSPRAVERFAHDGWRLLYYQDGRSASVAVGESLRTGNRWLSLNGKVDASTGDDMPTQLLSGQLPLRLMVQRAPVSTPLRAAVVGLASGVTAAATLDSGASEVTVLELEPAVLQAARHFSAVNGNLLEDERATVLVDDARAWLARPGPRYHALISEPSNPWITGVSNLFTQEYWALGHDRLVPGGVFVQWVQLYALPPDALRSLVRTFCTVFHSVWLFESIPGADALLVGTTRGSTLPRDQVMAIGLDPLLSPAQLDAFAKGARLNTDDAPWVEFAAPRWLHRQTASTNQAALEAAAAPDPQP